MPLKIFDAVSFQKIITSGGSTNPWRVMVCDEKGVLREFVVKLFTERQMEQQHPIAKEMFGNVLAREFDLPVPEVGLVHFSNKFIELLPSEAKKQLDGKDSGLKFGCEWKAMSIVDPSNLKSILKDYDLATVFAFDNFVFNLDRGGYRKKPNLLIDDEDFLLIDHEQIFPFADDVDNDNSKIIQDFQEGIWHYPAEKHLFHPHLYKMRKNAKSDIFDTFWSYLQSLNVVALREMAYFLASQNISIGNFELVEQYVQKIKANPDKFCNLLIQKII